jgi:hypothetical protein
MMARKAKFDKQGYRVLQFTEKQWREDPEFVNCVGVTLDKIRKDNHLDMDFWLAPDRPGLANEDEPCGTAGCLAGHAFLALGTSIKVRTVRDFRVVRNMEPESWTKYGANMFGISESDANVLFVTDYWPTPIKDAYDMGDWEPDHVKQRIRFNALVRAVEWMIEKREARRAARKKEA